MYGYKTSASGQSLELNVGKAVRVSASDKSLEPDVGKSKWLAD